MIYNKYIFAVEMIWRLKVLSTGSNKKILRQSGFDLYAGMSLNASSDGQWPYIRICGNAARWELGSLVFVCLGKKWLPRLVFWDMLLFNIRYEMVVSSVSKQGLSNPCFLQNIWNNLCISPNNYCENLTQGFVIWKLQISKVSQFTTRKV